MYRELGRGRLGDAHSAVLKRLSFSFTLCRFLKDSVDFYWQLIFLKGYSQVGTFFCRLKRFVYYLLSHIFQDQKISLKPSISNFYIIE
jgi:hypothetical protein